MRRPATFPIPVGSYTYTILARLVLGWVVSGWVVSGWVAAAEMTTVAYVVDRAGFEELSVAWNWPEREQEDPFAPQAMEEFVAPTPLEHEPNGSRFFAEVDEMWLMTGTLLQQKVLTHERSWAVWNERTERLVVHGRLEEHRVVGDLCRALVDVRLTQVEVGLIKVRCRELGAVDWTAEEVRKRGGKTLGSVAVKARPGQKAMVKRGAGKMGLEVESNFEPDNQIMDVRFNFFAEVDHADGARRLELATGLVVLAGERVYHEVGGADGDGETYVVWVEGDVEFMNGLPVRQWREFETPERKQAFLEHKRNLGVMEDGTRIRKWLVPPTFVADILPLESASAEAKDRAPLKRGRDFPGLGVEGEARDLGEIMKDAGIAIPGSGWVCYLEGSSTLVSRLDNGNTKLMEYLVGDHGPPSLPRLIHTTVSVIEWEGELEPGRIPAGAWRLARAGVVGRPGQKLSLRHGWPAEELKRGVSLLVEPNTGINNRIADVRIDLEVGGARPLEVSTALTVNVGTPVVVPLGKTGGKQRGVLVECRVSGGTLVEVDP